MARPTQTRQNTREAPPAAPNSGDVVVYGPPRLAYHPAIQDRFGIDKSAWKVLVESTWPNARTPEAVILALSYCKARNLDPYKRPVHIVPITIKKTVNGKDIWVEIETVWPAISETRTTAFRTKNYAGMDPPTFGPTKTFNLIDQVKNGNDYTDVPIKVDAPEWCQITVHRLVDGVARAYPGPRCYWLEFYAPKNRFVTAPNEQWRRKPSYMIEKCAEATSLRRAFPEEYGDKYAIEELGSLGHLRSVAGEATFSTPKVEPGPEPDRAAYRPAKAAAAGAQEEPPPADDPRSDGPAPAKDKPAAQEEPPRNDAPAGEDVEDQQAPGDSGGAGQRDSHRVEAMGEAAIIKAMEAAIDAAASADVVGWIMEDNKDRLAKFSTNKESAMKKRAADRIATLDIDAERNTAEAGQHGKI